MHPIPVPVLSTAHTSSPTPLPSSTSPAPNTSNYNLHNALRANKLVTLLECGGELGNQKIPYNTYHIHLRTRALFALGSIPGYSEKAVTYLKGFPNNLYTHLFSGKDLHYYYDIIHAIETGITDGILNEGTAPLLDIFADQLHILITEKNKRYHEYYYKTLSFLGQIPSRAHNAAKILKEHYYLEENSRHDYLYAVRMLASIPGHEDEGANLLLAEINQYQTPPTQDQVSRFPTTIETLSKISHQETTTCNLIQKYLTTTEPPTWTNRLKNIFSRSATYVSVKDYVEVAAILYQLPHHNETSVKAFFSEHMRDKSILDDVSQEFDNRFPQLKEFKEAQPIIRAQDAVIALLQAEIDSYNDDYTILRDYHRYSHYASFSVRARPINYENLCQQLGSILMRVDLLSAVYNISFHACIQSLIPRLKSPHQQTRQWILKYSTAYMAEPPRHRTFPIYEDFLCARFLYPESRILNEVISPHYLRTQDKKYIDYLRPHISYILSLNETETPFQYIWLTQAKRARLLKPKETDKEKLKLYNILTHALSLPFCLIQKEIVTRMVRENLPTKAE